MAFGVEFYSKQVQNPAKSREEGRPIFDEVEMVSVHVTGDKHFNPHFPAHEPKISYDPKTRQDDRRTWAERFPNEYRAFKESRAPAISGTPIEQWAQLCATQVSEYKALGIHTVEQIAEMNDRNRAVLGTGARGIIAQAKAYMEKAKGDAPMAKMADELEALRAELARLKAEQAA